MYTTQKSTFWFICHFLEWSNAIVKITREVVSNFILNNLSTDKYHYLNELVTTVWLSNQKPYINEQILILYTNISLWLSRHSWLLSLPVPSLAHTRRAGVCSLLQLETPGARVAWNPDKYQQPGSCRNAQAHKSWYANSKTTAPKRRTTIPIVTLSVTTTRRSAWRAVPVPVRILPVRKETSAAMVWSCSTAIYPKRSRANVNVRLRNVL